MRGRHTLFLNDLIHCMHTCIYIPLTDDSIVSPGGPLTVGKYVIKEAVGDCLEYLGSSATRTAQSCLDANQCFNILGWEAHRDLIANLTCRSRVKSVFFCTTYNCS